MNDDIEKYIEKRKRADKVFAHDFDAGYEEFKIGVMLRQVREQGPEGASFRNADELEALLLQAGPATAMTAERMARIHGNGRSRAGNITVLATANYWCKFPS